MIQRVIACLIPVLYMSALFFLGIKSMRRKTLPKYGNSSIARERSISYGVIGSSYFIRTIIMAFIIAVTFVIGLINGVYLYKKNLEVLLNFWNNINCCYFALFAFLCSALFFLKEKTWDPFPYFDIDDVLDFSGIKDIFGFLCFYCVLDCVIYSLVLAACIRLGDLTKIIPIFFEYFTLFCIILCAYAIVLSWPRVMYKHSKKEYGILNVLYRIFDDEGAKCSTSRIMDLDCIEHPSHYLLNNYIEIIRKTHIESLNIAFFKDDNAGQSSRWMRKGIIKSLLFYVIFVACGFMLLNNKPDRFIFLSFSILLVSFVISLFNVLSTHYQSVLRFINHSVRLFMGDYGFDVNDGKKNIYVSYSPIIKDFADCKYLNMFYTINNYIAFFYILFLSISDENELFRDKVDKTIQKAIEEIDNLKPEHKSKYTYFPLIVIGFLFYDTRNEVLSEVIELVNSKKVDLSVANFSKDYIIALMRHKKSFDDVTRECNEFYDIIGLTNDNA